MYIYQVTFTDDKTLLICAEGFYHNVITSTVTFTDNNKNVALFRWSDVKNIIKVAEEKGL